MDNEEIYILGNFYLHLPFKNIFFSLCLYFLIYTFNMSVIAFCSNIVQEDRLEIKAFYGNSN